MTASFEAVFILFVEPFDLLGELAPEAGDVVLCDFDQVHAPGD
jgi:hypothetical protein